MAVRTWARATETPIVTVAADPRDNNDVMRARSRIAPPAFTGAKVEEDGPVLVCTTWVMVPEGQVLFDSFQDVLQASTTAAGSDVVAV